MSNLGTRKAMRFKGLRMRAIGIVRMFAAIGGAISVAAPARAEDTIMIGVILPISGGAAYVGQGIGDGVRLAVDQISAVVRRRR
jgi:ABC-type branched-subunit amino acid transport system substrate-binding protein